MSLDPAVLSLLPCASSTSPSHPTKISLSPLSGGTSSARTQKLTVNDQSTTDSKATDSWHYFLKTSSSPDASIIFTGEHVSLAALSTAIPSLCPRPIGRGTYENDPRTSFLLTDFIESDRSSSTQFSDHENDEPPLSLAAKLARLHSLPPSVAESHEKPVFGFPVTTFCGDTPLDNSWCSTWAEFFAERRLLAIADRFEKLHGKDDELRNIVDRVCSEVVARLLGNGRSTVSSRLVSSSLCLFTTLARCFVFPHHLLFHDQSYEQHIPDFVAFRPSQNSPCVTY
jgi:fructosamine-3-kinase